MYINEHTQQLRQLCYIISIRTDYTCTSVYNNEHTNQLKTYLHWHTSHTHLLVKNEQWSLHSAHYNAMAMQHTNCRPLTTVHSVEPIVSNFRRKSFSVCVFPCLLGNSFSNLLYILMGFYQNLSVSSIWLSLTYKQKLNCRELQRVTVITSSSH